MIEEIIHENERLAIILRHDYNEPGIHFLTPNDYSQQLGYMNHPAGKIIPPHTHLPVRREVHNTQEALLLRKGRLRVDFFDSNQNYLKSRVLEAGDLILLIRGGHGFKVLEEIEMIEIKQGPYAGDLDKQRFEHTVADDRINFK